MSFPPIPQVDLSQAVELLEQGKILAYPTETVYGLGCDATCEKAIERLFQIKGRSAEKAISVLIPELESLPQYVEEVPSSAKALIDQYWPGPLTLILRAKKDFFPEALLAGSGKIALRLSSHPVAQALCRNFKRPITTTSANLSGQPAALTPQEIEKALAGSLDGILSGGVLPPSPGSTIVDATCHPFQVVRKGVLDTGFPAVIKNALGMDRVD